MFDMSWGEIMVIGGVALIVIGPKDLPKALRTVGQMTAKVRRLAGEFQSQFSEAMREADLQDVKKEMEGLHRDVASATSTTFNPIQTIRDELKGAVEANPASASASPQDWSSQSASSTATPGEWAPLPEPPAVPEPTIAAPETKALEPRSAGWSEYGPAQTSAPKPAVDPGTLNPDYVNPEARPPLQQESKVDVKADAPSGRQA